MKSRKYHHQYKKQILIVPMNIKDRRFFKLLIGLGFLCSLITGIFLSQLIDIPFGHLFHFVLYLFVGFLSVFLLGSAVFCFRATRLWLKITGAVPLLLSIIIIALTVIIRTDYRILYFQSFPPKPTKAEWIEDLHHLRDQMAEHHCDLNELISTAELDETVKAIENRIPGISDSEIVMELFRLTALPNDAHTFPFIMFPCFDIHTFPIQVYELEEGWMIVNAGREYKDLIGARIMKIGSKTIDDIYKTYPLFLAAESEYARKLRFPYMCFMAEWLAYHGIINDIQKAEFTLMKENGEEVVRSIPSIKFYPHFLWSSMFTIDSQLPPVFTNPRIDNYRFELMKESSTLYVQFNQCENQAGRETLDAFVLRLEVFVQNHEFERCVIDIRNNDGGNDIWGNLVRFLQDNDKINRRGRLFVLIGRRTFSSAVLFANQLQMQTHALFIGEPTGQGPIFYGGPYLIELPNSRLVFSVSTHLSVSGLPFDKRKSISPDMSVAYHFDDFMTGRDPVFETAQSVKIPTEAIKRIPVKKMNIYTGRYLLNPVQGMDVKLKDGSLHVSFTDFIPTSLQRFQSELIPDSDSSFRTRISGLNIRFSDHGRSGPKKMTISWQGETVTFNRAPNTHNFGFELFSQGEIEAGCQAIQKNRDIYLKHISNLENMLNLMGYDLMRQDDLKSALPVFQLNTKLYPKSYNVYDSYGEALLKNGDRDEAIKNYRQSLILNPDSPSGKRVLQEMGVER